MSLTTFDIKELGITEEELINRVVARISNSVMKVSRFDEDGNECIENTELMQKLEKAVRDAIDAKVAEVAEKHVLPMVSGMVENVVLQKTNSWGEKVGGPMTFTEYLVAQAGEFMQEKVNYKGEAKKNCSGYASDWKASGTRVEYMIDQHLQYSINEAVKKILAEANKQIASGLTGAVKMKLEELLNSIKIGVTTK